MGETVHVELPRGGYSSEIVDALGARGLAAEVIDAEDHCELHVRYAADENERLAHDVRSAIETWLSDRMLPLVVETANGGCVVRPPAE